METLTRKPAVVSKESVEKVLSIITTKKVSMSDITTEGKMSETTVRAAIKELADKINVEIVNKKNFYSIKESKKAALTQREVLKDFIITVVSTPAPKKALKKEVKEIIISDEIAEDNIKKYKPKNDDMILINGAYFKKGKGILELVKTIILENPDMSLSEIQEICHDGYNTKTGFIIAYSDLKLLKSASRKKRYFKEAKDVLRLKNGDVGLCSSQWGDRNINKPILEIGARLKTTTITRVPNPKTK